MESIFCCLPWVSKLLVLTQGEDKKTKKAKDTNGERREMGEKARKEWPLNDFQNSAPGLWARKCLLQLNSFPKHEDSG